MLRPGAPGAAAAAFVSVDGPPTPAGALWFLYARTFRNRLRAQFARAKNPRYLAAVVVGALYLWWALFRNSSLRTGSIGAIAPVELLLVGGGALLLLSSARWWLFGADRGALAFTPAEVQFLFPAPLTRRGLVHTKLVRLQLAILLNTLIFTVVLRGGGGTAEGWRRGIAIWALFSTLSLHRLGASIVRSSAIEHEQAGRRRGIIPLLVFGTLVGAVVYGLVTHVPDLRVASAQGFRALIGTIAELLGAPVPAAALWPARALLEPIFTAHRNALWLPGIGMSLAILLLHYAWVIRLDSAFEEAAHEATQHRAERLQRFRTSQMGTARSRKGKLTKVPALSLTGRPEVAIAWKNVVAALRGGGWRTQVLAFTGGLALLAVLLTRSASDLVGYLFLWMTLAWGAMLLFIGPLWMRFDLRLDLPRLEILKTLPLPGWRIVAAEIAGVTLLHSITVWTFMIVPLVMFAQDPALLLESGATIPILISIVVGVPVLNALMFTVQNGTALLFPAWVRLGTESRGFETMGQNLLTTGATTLVAAVALVFPVGAGGIILWITNDWGGWAVLLATLLASVLVALELWPVLRWLGTVFEKTDINDVPQT